MIARTRRATFVVWFRSCDLRFSHPFFDRRFVGSTFGFQRRIGGPFGFNRRNNPDEKGNECDPVETNETEGRRSEDRRGMEGPCERTVLLWEETEKDSEWTVDGPFRSLKDRGARDRHEHRRVGRSGRPVDERSTPWIDRIGR